MRTTAGEHFDLAIEDYGETLKLVPSHAGAYTNRGLVWLRLREWENFKSELITARRMGVDVIKGIKDTIGSVGNFERILGVRLPADIVALLTN